jgi:hypothetical protein
MHPLKVSCISEGFALVVKVGDTAGVSKDCVRTTENVYATPRHLVNGTSTSGDNSTEVQALSHRIYAASWT